MLKLLKKYFIGINKNMNLLFVEDDKTHQELLGILLNTWGINFDIASNGKEAVNLAQLNEGKYDICLMDTDMPEMDGFEATKKIRRKVKYFPILSTSANTNHKNKLLEIGADEFIAKPYDLEKLRQKIIEWGATRIFLLKFQKNSLETLKEMPMDAKHAKELKDLAKKNLCKMTLSGQNVTLVVHKNVPNKIAYDFIQNNLEVSTFLDRNSELPGECHLYKSSGLIPIVHFEIDTYQAKVAKEDEEMERYHELIFKKKE